MSATIFLFIVYMLYAIIDLYEIDTLNIVGLFTYQAIVGLIMALLTAICALIIGLPIRLNSRVNSWWRKNPGIWIGILALGIFLMLMAWSDNFSEVIYTEPGKLPREIPHYGISIVGWCFIAFALVHSYLHEAYHKLFAKLYRSWES